jgi:hypothetical protein
MRYDLRSIPPGRAGTDATLEAIGRLIADSQRTPQVRITALSILESRNVNTRDQARAVQALFAWIKRTIRYVRDPIDVETVQAPHITLALKAGDCDDHAALMAAFAANLGYSARLVTIGKHADEMVHIYPEILVNGRWIAADTTVDQPFGFRAKLPVTRIYDLRGKKIMNMGSPTTVLPIAKSDLVHKMYLAAYNQMNLNWERGLINRSDVAGYLRVLNEGNSPFRGTIADPPVRRAITDFLKRIDQTGAQSSKPAGSLSGLEGMNGFLKSVFKAVTSVVKGAVKLVTGGGDKQIIVNPPTINIPPGVINTTVPPASAAAAATAGIAEMFSNPVVLIALGVGAVLLFTRRN